MPQPTPLTSSDIEHFLTFGFVVVKEAFSRSVADAAVAEAFERLGYDPNDPATWAEDKIHLSTTQSTPVQNLAPKVWAATCQLLGGEERVKTPYNFGNGYIVNLRYGAEQPPQPPSPEMKGWHKDGDFFRHFLDSPEQGLLSIVCWSDVVHGGGPTYIATDSIPVVARFLADHPEGVDPGAFSHARLIDQCSTFVEATAEAGDVFLIHPYVLHAASPNTIGAIRVITNPPASLLEPMNFDREDPATFSPVERGVLRALSVERYDFQPTQERERIVPARIKRQQAWEEQRATEKEAAAK